MKLKDRVSRLQISSLVAVGLLLVLPGSTWAQTVVTTIPLDAKPHAVAVNPVTHKIYSANCSPGFSFHAGHGSVTVTDRQTGTTTDVPGITSLGTCLSAVAVNQVTNKVYVVGYVAGSGSIIAIDGTTSSTTTLPGGGKAVAVNSVTNKIYVAGANGDVTVIDGATNSTTTVTDPHANGLSPSGIAINPATNKIYIANSGSGSNPGNVTMIDGTSNSTTTITDPNAIFPSGVAVNPATNRVYVANMGTGTNHGNVTVIDGITNSITTITDPNALSPGRLNSGGFAVAVNSATNKIYVANAGSNNVTVIDGATNATTTVSDPNAVAPVAVAVDSVTNRIYVANDGCFFAFDCGNPGSVTIINGATNAVTTVIDPKAIGPTALAVDPSTDKIFAADSAGLFAGNMTEIDGGGAAISHTLTVVLPFSGGSGTLGTVTSNPAGINCTLSASTPGTCPASFPTGTVVSLTASPGPGYVFSGWSTNCTGIGTCNVTMSSDEFVTATFNLIDFSITPASRTLTMQRGAQTTDVITIAPLNGVSFAGTIQLSCAVTGSTPLSTCSLSPASVTPGANSVTATLKVTAPTQSAQLMPSREGQLSNPLCAVFLPIPLALIGIGLASGKSKNRRRSLGLLCSLLIVFVTLQVGCGGGSSSPPPPPSLNYTVAVTATSGAIQHTTQVTVTVQ